MRPFLRLPMTYRWLAAALLLLTLALSPGRADAHAALIRAEPADGTTVEQEGQFWAMAGKLEAYTDEGRPAHARGRHPAGCRCRSRDGRPPWW